MPLQSWCVGQMPISTSSILWAKLLPPHKWHHLPLFVALQCVTLFFSLQNPAHKYWMLFPFVFHVATRENSQNTLIFGGKETTAAYTCKPEFSAKFNRKSTWQPPLGNSVSWSRLKHSFIWFIYTLWTMFKFKARKNNTSTTTYSSSTP